MDHTSQQVSQLAEAERPGKTWGPGAVAGGQTWFHASCSGPGRARACPRTRSPVGTQACAPPGRLRVSLQLKLPHPALGSQTWTEGLQVSKVWAKLQEKGL